MVLHEDFILFCLLWLEKLGYDCDDVPFHHKISLLWIPSFQLVFYFHVQFTYRDVSHWILWCVGTGHKWRHLPRCMVEITSLVQIWQSKRLIFLPAIFHLDNHGDWYRSCSLIFCQYFIRLGGLSRRTKWVPGHIWQLVSGQVNICDYHYFARYYRRSKNFHLVHDNRCIRTFYFWDFSHGLLARKSLIFWKRLSLFNRSWFNKVLFGIACCSWINYCS